MCEQHLYTWSSRSHGYDKKTQTEKLCSKARNGRPCANTKVFDHPYGERQPKDEGMRAYDLPESPPRSSSSSRNGSDRSNRRSSSISVKVGGQTIDIWQTQPRQKKVVIVEPSTSASSSPRRNEAASLEPARSANYTYARNPRQARSPVRVESRPYKPINYNYVGKPRRGSQSNAWEGERNVKMAEDTLERVVEAAYAKRQAREASLAAQKAALAEARTLQMNEAAQAEAERKAHDLHKQLRIDQHNAEIASRPARPSSGYRPTSPSLYEDYTSRTRHTEQDRVRRYMHDEDDWKRAGGEAQRRRLEDRMRLPPFRQSAPFGTGFGNGYW